MKTLVLRIYLALVAVLALFALAGGALVNWHFERERETAQRLLQERLAPWAEFAQAVLPEADRPDDEQARALDEVARRWRAALALEDAAGRRIAASASFARREQDWRARMAEAARADPAQAHGMGQTMGRSLVRLALPDGRQLLIWRGRAWRGEGEGEAPGPALAPAPGPGLGPGPGVGPSGSPSGLPAGWPPGPGGPPGPPWAGPPPPRWWAVGPGGLVLLLGAVFVAVALAAWPVARRLTRRVETLQRGVEAFGDGRLHQRVPVEGRDEISALARSFNAAAERIEALVAAHRSLLANASHEIRSPLARLKMAVSMMDEPPGNVAAEAPTDASHDPAYLRQRRLRAEVDANIAELDALVEEVLLASRLEARPGLEAAVPVDLARLVADEADRLPPRAGFALTVASGPGSVPAVLGDEKLLRRAVRNLLENARRYGGEAAEVSVRTVPAGGLSGDGHRGPPVGTVVEVAVEDHGPGVPAEHRERIFESFFRLPGHAEQQGGVGLGLSLVRQIAQRHGGRVRCDAGPGGRGSRFVLDVPVAGA